MSDILEIGLEKIKIEQIVDVAYSDKKIALSKNPAFVERIQRSRELLENKLKNNQEVYGVTTGYGDSCKVKIPKELQKRLPLQLTRYHQCGLGKVFDRHETRAIQIARIISLSQGYSAVRMELLEHMVTMFNLGVTARIPQEGSVGASGDLTPLAYYAATLVGEGEMFYQDQLYPSAELYERLGVEPIILIEKEALALMNGTAVMTALACKVFYDAKYLTKLSSRITSVASLGLLANSKHFNSTIFKAKPHAGTIEVGQWIRDDLSSAYDNKILTRLQNQYSIRCAPHIIGVLVDGLSTFREMIETELNSANDNPLTDVENDEILHGGNFYGGHIAFAMDSLKVLIANIADLLDRQIALLVDEKFNNGLQANLSAVTDETKFLCHGLKAVQISSSAWTAEALKNTMSASIFSRSTECHNQDKVSMGTIAARDAVRILELTNQVAAAALLTAIQALDLRLINGELTEEEVGNKIISLKNQIRSKVDLIVEDRPLENDLRSLIESFESHDESLIV